MSNVWQNRHILTFDDFTIICSCNQTCTTIIIIHSLFVVFGENEFFPCFQSNIHQNLPSDHGDQNKNTSAPKVRKKHGFLEPPSILVGTLPPENYHDWLETSTMNESMYFLLEMEIFEPVMLVFMVTNMFQMGDISGKTFALQIVMIFACGFFLSSHGLLGKDPFWIGQWLIQISKHPQMSTGWIPPK